MENIFCFIPTLNECTARSRSISAVNVAGTNWVHGTWLWNGPSRTLKYYENAVDQNRNNVYSGGTDSADARVSRKNEPKKKKKKKPKKKKKKKKEVQKKNLNFFLISPKKILPGSIARYPNNPGRNFDGFISDFMIW